MSFLDDSEQKLKQDLFRDKKQSLPPSTPPDLNFLSFATGSVAVQKKVTIISPALLWKHRF
jgi:hypothetical protein